MDKTIYAITTTQRRGFALIITLSVLSVVIALTMVLLSYFNEVKNDADSTQALIQANLFYSDIVNEIKKHKDSKSIFKELYNKPLILATKDSKFILSLECKPIANGVNINWLGFENNSTYRVQSQVAQSLFESLIQQYNLKDGNRLREMILQEIVSKKEYIDKPQSRLTQKNGIISYRQFREIISRYQFEVDDLKVSKIPWKRYFSFYKDTKKIDVKYASSELISFIFNIDVSLVKEWKNSLDKTSLKTFVDDNGGDYNSKKVLFEDNSILGKSFCEVHYRVNDEAYHFTFNYTDGEAKYFEFYGKH